MRIALGLLAAWLVAAALPLRGADNVPLGSPDFYPSPEHPVGWRGDGSGRFPGATPPTLWGRQFADITSQIVVQALRPKGKEGEKGEAPGADGHLLEYSTLKDWLIAGPFPAADPEKDIDVDFLGGEGQVQPDAGAKAGDKEWKLHRAYEGSQSYHNINENTCGEMWVDFVYALGTLIPREHTKHWNDYPNDVVRYADIEKQAAYAHTYLYAPREGDVDLDIHHGLPALKVWINGSPQRVSKDQRGDTPGLKIHLNKGWNRLLVKAICDQAQGPYFCAGNFPSDILGQTKWRFAAYLRPAGSRQQYSGGYETKNISWMLKLTGRNVSQPIVVGDRLFVGGGDTDLFCVDKRSGKIAWMHTGTWWDGMSAQERAAVKDTAEPLLAELDKSNAELVALLSENITPQGLDGTRQAALDKKLEERNKFLKSLHNALSTGKKGKLYTNARNEASAGSATPTSDGKFVYWVVQGDGGYLTSAFDLDGKLIWSQFDFENSGTGEHGSHSSPLLYQGTLYVCTPDNLVARDAATGKELWRSPGARRWADRPVVVQFNGSPALQTSKNLLSLNGEVLATGGYAPWDCYIPVVEEGILYNCSNRGPFEAIAIPTKEGEKHRVNWKLDTNTMYNSKLSNYGFTYYIASPLFVDGLLYQINIPGNLVVIDTRQKKLAYQHFVDGYDVNGSITFGYTVSPTLAGKNIYLLDPVGYATILKPGAEGTVIGHNKLENTTNLPASAPGKQEVFYAGMWFDGKRMFIHGDEYLYCIEEK